MMLEGHLLSERYLIKKKIGGGGMANVYLADDTILDREVAIKVLRLEYANDAEFIARFDREAQAASSLSHPNIVNIYDVGEENHILYMVMEFVDGMTLKEYIQSYGPIAVPEALEIMKQITSAIAHAHAHDLVHRDIKPQNILIDTYGRIKVTDFGIATALSATALTQTNSVLGSVHYLSPEQARGGLATKLSDIYSLGIVFFELLTGQLPFSGQTPVSIALKHLQADTPSVRSFNPDIPQSVENIVLKATAKDPFHRYDSVYEMYVDLETALHPDRLHEAVYTPPVEAGEETKAIPIITDNHIHHDVSQDETIIHQKDDTTKKLISPQQGDSPPKKKKRRKLKWFLVSFLLLVALGVASLFILPGLFQPKDVTVPDVSNLEYEEAVEQLKVVRLNAEREFIFSDEVEKDHVVYTEPRAGRTAKEGHTVKVFVSQGKETITFDDYVGRDYNQVERILANLGFTDILVYEKYSDEPPGEIISQIQPLPGTDVVPSDTRVIFEVSVGPQLVRLQNLRGLSEQEARQYIDSQQLKMNKTEEYSDTVPIGHVIRHEPEANAEVQKGATVNVVVSQGPEMKPPDIRTVTFTVPYKETELEEGEQPSPQTVLIYVEDMNNRFTDVFREDQITADKQYTVTLTIAPDREAFYRVIRDDELIIEERVRYKEGG